MSPFLEHIEILKKMFEEFDLNNKALAIDHTEDFLNWMTFKWQSQSEQPGYPVLMQNAEEIIMDRFAEEWQVENPEMEQQVIMYYPDNSDQHNVPSTSHEHNTPTNFSLFCFTCGIGAKNEKALYRHGIRFSHQTRPKKRNRKSGEKPKSTHNEKLIENYEDTLPLQLLEEEEEIEEKEEETENIRKDTNSENLICFTCGSQFKNRKALYRHGIRFEHKTKGPKLKNGPFKCELCVEFSTSRVEYLRKHQKKHHSNQSTSVSDVPMQ